MHVHDSLNLSVITLCSRSRCGAREAMTVGCKPTRLGLPVMVEFGTSSAFTFQGMG